MSTEHPEFPLEQQQINRAAAALRRMLETERSKAGRAGVGGGMRMVERALRERPDLAPGDRLAWGSLELGHRQDWQAAVACR